MNREFYTGRKLDISPIAESVLGYETIYAKIVSSDPSVEYTQVFPAFVKGGCSSFEELCRRVLEQTQQSGPQLISAYWDEPDHTIHRHGISGGETQRVMNDLNNQVQAMVAAAPANTIFIITADHGAVDVDEIFLNEHKLSQYMKMPPKLCLTCCRAGFLSWLAYRFQSGKLQLLCGDDTTASWLAYRFQSGKLRTQRFLRTLTVVACLQVPIR